MSFSSLDQCGYQRGIVVLDDVKIAADIMFLLTVFESKTVARYCVE